VVALLTPTQAFLKTIPIGGTSRTRLKTASARTLKAIIPRSAALTNKTNRFNVFTTHKKVFRLELSRAVPVVWMDKILK
jgi:hypothetical protein